MVSMIGDVFAVVKYNENLEYLECILSCLVILLWGA